MVVPNVRVRELAPHITSPKLVHQKPRVPCKKGMHRANRAQAECAIDEKRTEAEQLAAAEAFLADTTSAWARIVPMNERRRS